MLYVYETKSKIDCLNSWLIKLDSYFFRIYSYGAKLPSEIAHCENARVAMHNTDVLKPAF